MTLTRKELTAMSTHELLHRLWTRAVGTTGYDKSEWTELATRTTAERQDPHIGYDVHGDAKR